MNRETAKRHLECIKAFSEGKNIQCYYGDNGWLDCDNPFWLDECKYRIKPEPEVFYHIFQRSGCQVTGVPIKEEAMAIKTCENNSRNWPEHAPYYIKKFVQDLSYESPA